MSIVPSVFGQKWFKRPYNLYQMRVYMRKVQGINILILLINNNTAGNLQGSTFLELTTLYMLRNLSHFTINWYFFIIVINLIIYIMTFKKFILVKNQCKKISGSHKCGVFKNLGFAKMF